MQIRNVGILGAGTMGSGIAHVFAKSGFNVHIIDLDDHVLERGLSNIKHNLGREAAKGKISADDIHTILARISPSTNRNALAQVDFAIEAASERFDIKKDIFQAIDKIIPPDVIIATNTSSISITKLAALTARPSRVIGMHFFNPVPVMTLVEVIRGLETSTDTSTTVHNLATSLGKTPVEVNDAPGFVSNRVLMPLINEAAYAVMEGVATPEAIDQIFKLGMAHPMGPLTLADFIGLDVCVDIMRVLLDGLGDTKYRPCPLIVKMVDAGWLGTKSGRGFYKYS